MSSIKRIMGTFLVWLTVFVQASLAAQFERQGKNIVLDGEITAGDLVRLKSMVQRYGYLRIELNSPGGSLSEALKIGAFVRSTGLATHIPRGATCASACVTIFAGGLLRTAHSNTKIGIHMGSAVFNEGFVDAMDKVIKKYGTGATPYVVAMFEEGAAMAMLKQVYFILEAGVSLKLLELTTLVPHNEIYWMSIDDAISVNLINYR
jgi:hypothetical protein